MKYLPLALLLILAGAAEGVDAQTILMDRHVSDFHSIKIQGQFKVIITQADSETVKLEMPEDMQEHVATVVQGGVLKVRNRRKDWFDRSWQNGHHPRVTVYITTKKLRSLTSSGSTDIRFDKGINADVIHFTVRGSGNVEGVVTAKTIASRISGSGNIKLHGRAENAAVHISGSGDFSGLDLVTAHAKVHISGSGHAGINASDEVGATLHGSGGLSYTGTTNIHASKSGSASVNRL